MKTIEYLDSIINAMLKLGNQNTSVYLVLTPEDLRKFEEGLKELGSIREYSENNDFRFEYSGYTFFISTHQMP